MTKAELRQRKLQQQFLSERQERLRDEEFEKLANLTLPELVNRLDTASKGYRTHAWTAELMTESDDKRRKELIQAWRRKFEKGDPSEFQPEIVFTNQQIWDEFYAWNRNRSAQIQKEHDSQQSLKPPDGK